METFAPSTDIPPQPAPDRADLGRELAALVCQWPPEMQQSFMKLARYLTDLLAPHDAALPFTATAGPTPGGPDG